MQFVEYIQNGTSTATSHNYRIDFGYVPTENTRTEIEFETDHNLSDELFGAYLTYPQAEGKMWRLFGYRGISFDCPRDGSARMSVNVDLNVHQVIKCWIDNGSAYLENTTRSQQVHGTMPQQINSDITLKLWSPTTNNNSPGAIKIYSVKIYESNVLRMDLVPAINNSNVIGMYDMVGGGFYYNELSGEMIAGPVLSSISISPMSASFKASGGTTTIDIYTENSWVANPADGTWYTLSATAGTGNSTITITVPSYSGGTDRTDTITFVDTNTTDEADFALKQKKYVSGQPVFLGANECAEMYLGALSVSEAYLGLELVYSSGPFTGLKLSPKTLSFSDDILVQTIKIKSSEPWDITTPAWITADIQSGDTGTTTVTLSATTQTTETSGNVVVTSTTYSASCDVDYSIGTPYLDVVGSLGIATDFYVGEFYRSDRYIKYEVAAKGNGNGTTSSTYLYETSPYLPWFSMESFTTGSKPYVNIAGLTTVFSGNTGGNGLDHPWTIVVDMENGASIIDGVTAQTKTITGSWPADGVNLIFFGTYSANSNTRFYHMKIWDRNGNLVKHFVPDQSGSIKDLVSGTVYSITGSGTSTYGLEIS